jgi:uncharacterized protein
VPQAFLTAQWRYLAMLNYRIAPSVLAPYVPAGTALDLWRGEALVSVVGFRFLDTRLLGLPVPLHRDFEEVNLRFYVRAVHESEVRRGVTFIRELVPRRLIALVARLTYNEPYLALPMRSVAPAAPTEAPGPVEYAWRNPRQWNRLAVQPSGPPMPLAPDSEAEFVAARHWGYTRQRDGGTVEYEVVHPRWRVWPVERAVLECDVAGLYGAQFVDALAGAPSSAHLADGSAVTVFRPQRLSPTPTPAPERDRVRAR